MVDDVFHRIGRLSDDAKYALRSYRVGEFLHLLFSDNLMIHPCYHLGGPNGGTVIRMTILHTSGG